MSAAARPQRARGFRAGRSSGVRAGVGWLPGKREVASSIPPSAPPGAVRAETSPERDASPSLLPTQLAVALTQTICVADQHSPVHAHTRHTPVGV